MSGINECLRRPGVNRTDAKQSSPPCSDPHMANKFAASTQSESVALWRSLRVTRVAEASLLGDVLTRVRRSRDDGTVHVSEGELLTTNISEVADKPLQSGAMMHKHHSLTPTSEHQFTCL